MIYCTTWYPEPKIVEEDKKRYIEIIISYCPRVEIQEFRDDYYRILIFTAEDSSGRKETRRIIILNNRPRSLFEETEIMVITINKEGTEVWREIIYDNIIDARIEKEIRDETDDIITIRTTYKLVF
jgi:hypothetical protein